MNTLAVVIVVLSGLWLIGLSDPTASTIPGGLAFQLCKIAMKKMLMQYAHIVPVVLI
jgi:hypothetical protein